MIRTKLSLILDYLLSIDSDDERFSVLNVLITSVALSLV